MLVPLPTGVLNWCYLSPEKPVASRLMAYRNFKSGAICLRLFTREYKSLECVCPGLNLEFLYPSSLRGVWNSTGRRVGAMPAGSPVVTGQPSAKSEMDPAPL